ncbi:MAG: hypothetical protein ACREK7_08635, partial [Gemmatimonadota bacterium]
MKWQKGTKLLIAALVVAAIAGPTMARDQDMQEYGVILAFEPVAEVPELRTPTRAFLLAPRELDALSKGEVREAILEVPEGPLARALRGALEKRQGLGDLTLGSAPTGKAVRFSTITLTDVRVTGYQLSPDKLGRVKVRIPGPARSGMSNTRTRGGNATER